MIEAAPKLPGRSVGRAGVGVDNVDLRGGDRARRGRDEHAHGQHDHDRPSTPLRCCVPWRATSHAGTASCAAASGSKKGLLGTELTGKVLGIVGLGRIGRVVAERGLGLRMKVLAHDPYLEVEAARSSPIEGVPLVALDELLARADFVTLHVPLSDATRDLISNKRAHRLP